MPFRQITRRTEIFNVRQASRPVSILGLCRQRPGAATLAAVSLASRHCQAKVKIKFCNYTSSSMTLSGVGNYSVRQYTPLSASWPYQATDFARQDESDDNIFYAPPRFVKHIDDNAVASLSQYYVSTLPRQGKLLELCGSWVSHFPPEIADSARRGAAGGTQSQGSPSLMVTGYGMNAAELEANPLYSRRVVKNLNSDPCLDNEDHRAPMSYDAAVCVVSIDYLTKPREVLAATLASLKPGASVHLAISNRCFPTKAVAKWLNVPEQQRLDMVGDYLWFSGFRDVEIVTVVGGQAEDDSLSGSSVRSWFAAMKDPLWVVRGRKPANVTQT